MAEVTITVDGTALRQVAQTHPSWYFSVFGNGFRRSLERQHHCRIFPFPRADILDGRARAIISLATDSGNFNLFDAIDPSPFRERDLDPKAEEFIVGWAKDLPRDDSLALVVDLDREAGLPNEAAVLRDAIHEFFRHRAEMYRRRLRELFRLGRTSLLIGIVVLAAAIAFGDFLSKLMKGSGLGEIVRESLTIGGWVSMWRPLEVFLYDWWPIRNEARLSDRLAAMPVRIRYANAPGRDAWRVDWPVVSPGGEKKAIQGQPRAVIQEVDTA